MAGFVFVLKRSSSFLYLVNGIHILTCLLGEIEEIVRRHNTSCPVPPSKTQMVLIVVDKSPGVFMFLTVSCSIEKGS